VNFFKNIFYAHSVFPFRIIVLKPTAIAYPPHTTGPSSLYTGINTESFKLMSP